MRSVRVEYLYVNRRTDMKLIVTFRNFAKAPNYTDVCVVGMSFQN
jgi:hypothetical protein